MPFLTGSYQIGLLVVNEMFMGVNEQDDVKNYLGLY